MCGLCPSVLAAVALTTTVQAEVNTRIDWQVSLDNVHWGVAATARPGQVVLARAVVTYTGSASPFGLQTLLFQPVVSNWDAVGVPGSMDVLLPFVNAGRGGNTSTPVGVVTNTADARQFGRIMPWGRTALSETRCIRGFVHTNGAGGAPSGKWLRISQAWATSWIGGSGNTTGGLGVPISQLMPCDRCKHPDPPLRPGLNSIDVFKFGFILSPDQAARTMVVDSPVEGLGNYNPESGLREVGWRAEEWDEVGLIRGTAIINPATISVVPCGSADFDQDGDVGTDRDIEAFFACLAGSCCATCFSADFNGDGDVGTDADIEEFLRVLAGGGC